MNVITLSEVHALSSDDKIDAIRDFVGVWMCVCVVWVWVGVGVCQGDGGGGGGGLCLCDGQRI